MRNGLAVLVGLVVAVVIGILVVTGLPTLDLFAAGAMVVGFVLAYAIVVSMQGLWPAAVGGLAAFLLTFLLTFPVVCSGGSFAEGGTVSREPTTCSNLLRLPMPGFSGDAQDFSPTYTAPTTLALVAGLVVFFAGRRRRASRPLASSFSQ